MPPKVTAALARFAVGYSADAIPSPVRQHAVRAILNGFGTALGGAGDRAIVALFKTLVPFSGSASATLIGRQRQVDMPTAAFLNAAAINVFDFDDTHYDTIIHPTAPVLPALLAFAEQDAVSGAAMVDAFVIGAEIGCRIGVGVSPSHYRRGWHITSTCGVYGAATAVGRLMRLTEEEMIWALGNASAQASGLVETLGSMAKSVSVGGAARGGLLAALMARNGVEGPALPIEGERGFMRAFSDTVSFDAVTEGLGERWELMRNAFKPYPCGVVLNPVIDACLALRADARFAADAIARIEVSGNPLLKERTDRPGVTTGREAQVSAQHAVAVSLLRGTAGIADFDDAAVNDARVRALAGKVAPVAIDEAMPVGAARVVLKLGSGASIERAVTEASGSPKNPMTDAALEEKFKSLAAYGGAAVDPEPLMAALWALEDAPDVEAIAAAARPAN